MVRTLPGSSDELLSWDKHILNSLEEFHEPIDKLVLGPNDILVTADFKDFSVVGQHQYLAKMAASIWSAKDLHLADQIVLFLLQNLFVTSIMIDGKSFCIANKGPSVVCGEWSNQ